MMKHFYSLAWMMAMLSGGLLPLKVVAEEDAIKCPIMVDKEVNDRDHKLTYKGKDFYVCCSPCIKQFKKDADYLAAVIKEMKTVPALAEVETPANIQLMEQRFCPISTKRLISPGCPTVEYRGVTIYLARPRSVQIWNANPDKLAKKAFEKGLLPQLKGKM